MKKILFIIAISICVMLSACGNQEEKRNASIHKLIDQYMFDNLPSYPTYEPINLNVDSVYYDYSNDSLMFHCGERLMSLERMKKINGKDDKYNREWYNCMDSIRLLLKTIDTTQLQGYFVTLKYRCANYRGVYEINTINFIVNSSLDKIKLYKNPTMYEKQIQEVYLPSAFDILKDDSFVEYLKLRQDYGVI